MWKRQLFGSDFKKLDIFSNKVYFLLSYMKNEEELKKLVCIRFYKTEYII